MKKIILIISLSFFLLFIGNKVYGADYNPLDEPIGALNGKTYREVFKHGSLFEWQEYEVIVDSEAIRLNGQYYYPSSNINYYIRIDATRYQAVNASRDYAVYGFEFIGFPTPNNSYINTSYKTYGRDTRLLHLYGHTLFHELYIWDLNILGLQNVSKETLDKHYNYYQIYLNNDVSREEGDFQLGDTLRVFYDTIYALLGQTNVIWEWLSKPLEISLEWLKIPFILPDGLNIKTGIVPMNLLGIGIITLIAMWFVKLFPAA